MDRLEAMRAFVVTVDAGSFSAAARQLRCSPASTTRAVAGLEARLGAQLLRRTTRSLALTEPGERYLTTCRRVLAELAEAEQQAAGAVGAPQGLLTVTAPTRFGALHVRPALQRCLATHPALRARLLLLDRVVNVVDEGIDVAIRIADLPDSALVAVKVGELHRVTCASPDYLSRRGRPKAPTDLAGHACIGFSALTATDTWTFGAGKGGGRKVRVAVRPVLTVNTAEAAVGAAVDGVGVTCALSYQVEDELRAGRLVRLLADHEPAPVPVHVVHAASATSAKVRAFVEVAVPHLRAVLSPKRRTARS
ncbi:MAG: LysR family transcriptional regulator [Myxococcales bacterium]|nr:LysR family transcriptional regulator [Myxococcales bacterium]